MKKILLLGGAFTQIPSIKCAKELGYYVITCDYLPNNPGHKYADEYHNVSTTDKEAVLELAKKLNIDGIVCYASDPAAPTAAYVAEKLSLPGQPFRSVEILSYKSLFRKFLKENNFNVPNSKTYSNKEELKKEWDNFLKPVMVKPVDSSGSKGVSKIYNIDEIENAFEYALSYSRIKNVIVEEFIEVSGPQHDGDVFSVDGIIKFASFSDQYFDLSSNNPFSPVGESWPCTMEASTYKLLMQDIQRIIDLLKLKTGVYNVETRISSEGKPYILEMGARNGGNMVPQVIQYATGVNLVEYTLKAGMGEDCSSLHQEQVNGFWSYHILHSKKTGIFKNVNFKDDFKKNNLIELILMKKEGDKVAFFQGSGEIFGIMILKFSSLEDMKYKLTNIDEYVNIIIE